MTNKRKAEIFDNILRYKIETQGAWDVVFDLKNKFGLTDEEITKILTENYLEPKGEN